MKHIPISEDARFAITDDNYILEYRVKSGTRPGGKEATKEFQWILDGYYGSLVSMLHSYVSNAPRRQDSSEMTTLKDVVNCILEAEKKIERLLPKNN